MGTECREGTEEVNAGRGLWGKGCGKGTVGKGIWEGDCEERDDGRGQWGKECMEGTVGKQLQGGDHGERDEGKGLGGKEMQGGDCGEREEGKGLWGKGYKAGSVWKWMQEGDHGGRDPGSLVSKDLKTNEISAVASKRQGLLLHGAGLVACFRGQAQHHSPSIAFQHLPPNSARFSYATEGALFISTQLSTDTVSALRKAWVLIRL